MLATSNADRDAWENLPDPANGVISGESGYLGNSDSDSGLADSRVLVFRLACKESEFILPESFSTRPAVKGVFFLIINKMPIA